MELTNHDDIRRWADTRGGKPAHVKGTTSSSDPGGILRIDFPQFSGAEDENLEAVDWDTWFDKFDEENLALVVDDDEDDLDSRFNKLVRRH